ncbi:hypothetical protein CB0940_01146 [Cercospora beticola]|uniref:Rrn9 domain-containing protein n=1 Tax=Cercospora beticola TaxID=122368 RepID=A0A2G5ICJ9_CERBT|nr:hypothetical protein CB0940_01146 [Cercospora beticola]PIB02491.1 hypothetical protein CB0940_01146 [Cercospora beticola]WPA96575.1 hypothetical protein RHO25_001182 [Cercospora beticola]
MAEEFKDIDLTADQAEGSQEEDSGDSERDGRFHGPDASWKFYTKAERELAASLDQIENNDLSAHLYNTHCLKQRSYNSLSVLPWQSKQRWIDRENSAPGLFLPDAHWTACPLKPAEVPRTGEAWGVAIPDDTLETYRYEESWLPGSQLRDCLQAEIQRQAKERLRLRTFSAVDIDSQSSGEISTQTSETDSNGSEADASPSTSSSSSGESSDGAEQEDGDAANSNITARAFPSVDDEFATNLTRSAVGHIMSQFDAVLKGLHQSRMGHAREGSRSRPGSATSMPPTSPGTDSQTGHASVGSSPEPASRGSSARLHRGRQDLGTRDWSEVLGIAALVGVDPSIIARARHRCATLFNEDMDFRVMPDAALTHASEGLARDPARSASAAGGAPNVEMDLRDGYPCPHTSCDRHVESYPQLWRLREHLKRKHKHETQEINAMVGHMKQSANSRAGRHQLESDNADEDENGESQDPVIDTVVHHDEYLQPILIPIGRSRDRKKRRTPSREHLKRTKATQSQDIVVDGETS